MKKLIALMLILLLSAGALAEGGVDEILIDTAQDMAQRLSGLSVNGKHRKRVQAQRLSESVFVFRDVRLRRRINTLVLTGRDATDSAVICRRKEKTRK